MLKAAVFATTLALALSAAPAFAKSDKDFLSDAIKGDNSEITLGQLAIDHGDSTGVKEFGQMLVTDHRKAKDEAAPLAKTLGMTMPTEMTDEASKEMKKLQGLSGPAFDREFVSYMVDDHKKDVAEFQEQAMAGSGALNTYAEKTVPVLEKHLKTAQALAK